MSEPEDPQVTQVESSRPLFLPLACNAEPVHERSRCADIDVTLVYKDSRGFAAYLPNSVIQRAMAIAGTRTPREFIGLCAGQVFEDQEGQYVVLSGIVPDTEARATAGTVETSADSEFQTRRLLATLYPDSIPVGWCHSHVGIGTFFSAVDKENQATWNKPYHLGIVLDPLRREIAVFKGPEAAELERVQAGSGDDQEPGDSDRKSEPTPVVKHRVGQAVTTILDRCKPLIRKLSAPRLIPVLLAIHCIQVVLIIFLLASY